MRRAGSLWHKTAGVETHRHRGGPVYLEVVVVQVVVSLGTEAGAGHPPGGENHPGTVVTPQSCYLESGEYLVTGWSQHPLHQPQLNVR